MPDEMETIREQVIEELGKVAAKTDEEDETIVGVLLNAHDMVTDARNEIEPGPARREFALASSHIEDAIMRVNRAFAKAGRFFDVGDAEKRYRSKGE